MGIHDRGLHYGDGVFETIAVRYAQPRLWSRHMARLRAGCGRLGIEPPSESVLEQEADHLCSGAERAVLKIIVTRGLGERGYRPTGHSPPTRALIRHPWPDHPREYRQSGVHVRLCATPISRNTRLAGVKHLNRLEQVLARGEWEDPSIVEGLMCDEHGSVIEGTMTNLFLIRGKTLVTPDLSACGVAGIMRSVVLDRAPELGLSCEVAVIGVDDVKRADEVFLTNSLIGLWPVRRFDTTTYGQSTITREIEQLLQSELDF